MSIPYLQDLPYIYTSEWAKFDELIKTYPKTTSGNVNFTSDSSGIPYNSTTGTLGLILLLQTTLQPYLLNSLNWNKLIMQNRKIRMGVRI